MLFFYELNYIINNYYNMLFFYEEKDICMNFENKNLNSTYLKRKKKILQHLCTFTITAYLFGMCENVGPRYFYEYTYLLPMYISLLWIKLGGKKWTGVLEDWSIRC